jgi:hypothetical protein
MKKEITLYSKVKTPDGIGTVVGLNCLRVNGLYFDPNVTEVIVWYGTDNAANGFVQRTYDVDSISIV